MLYEFAVYSVKKFCRFLEFHLSKYREVGSLNVCHGPVFLTIR
jgi:hypothetical protein